MLYFLQHINSAFTRPARIASANGTPQSESISHRLSVTTNYSPLCGQVGTFQWAAHHRNPQPNSPSLARIAQVLSQTKPVTASEGCRMTRLASSRTGENSPYGMNRGGGGTVITTCWPFATMLERADTAEAIGLNQHASALLDQFSQLHHKYCNRKDLTSLHGTAPIVPPVCPRSATSQPPGAP
jgi:hypothetical protein